MEENFGALGVGGKDDGVWIFGEEGKKPGGVIRVLCSIYCIDSSALVSDLIVHTGPKIIKPVDSW